MTLDENREERGEAEVRASLLNLPSCNRGANRSVARIVWGFILTPLILFAGLYVVAGIVVLALKSEGIAEMAGLIFSYLLITVQEVIFAVGLWILSKKRKVNFFVIMKLALLTSVIPISTVFFTRSGVFSMAGLVFIVSSIVVSILFGAIFWRISLRGNTIYD